MLIGKKWSVKYKRLERISRAIREFFQESEPPLLLATTLLSSSGMTDLEGYYTGYPAQLEDAVYLKRMYSYLLKHPRGGASVAKSFACMVLAQENLAPVFLIRVVKLLEKNGWVWDENSVGTSPYIPPTPKAEDLVGNAQYFFGAMTLFKDLPDETRALKSEFRNYLV